MSRCEGLDFGESVGGAELCVDAIAECQQSGVAEADLDRVTGDVAVTGDAPVMAEALKAGEVPISNLPAVNLLVPVMVLVPPICG